MSVPTSFPTTLQEAINYYADEDNCLATAIRFRWPNGIECPHCGCTEQSFLRSRRIWKCKNKECRKQFSAKVGTIFEDSPLGLDKWFVAMWLIVNAKNGISSWELSRAIGVTQKTAWFMLHRLRYVLQGEDSEPLSGEVEVDETYIGGLSKNMHKHVRARKIKGTGGAGKTIVMGLLERKAAKRPSRVRAKVVTDTKKATLQGEVRANVEAGAEVHTDALPSYQGLGQEYLHQVVDHAVAYVEGNVHTNGLENFWSLLKRTVKGTYVSVDAVHLEKYLAEQAMRFNERKGKDQDRFCFAMRTVTGKRLTYAELIRREEGTLPRRGG